MKVIKDIIYSKIDYIYLSIIVVIVTLQPYFMHGAINFHEAGLYLPCIESIFRGEMPYRDIFVLRGPLELYLPFYLMKIFSKNIIVLRAFFYFGTVATLIIAVFFGKRLYKTRYFCYFMAFVLIAKTFARVNFANWGGIRFGIGLLAILFAVIFLNKERLRWIALSGFFAAMGFLISIEIGIFSALSVSAALFLCYIFKMLKSGSRALFIFLSSFFIIVVFYFAWLFLEKALIPYVNNITVFVLNSPKIFDLPSVQGSPKNIPEFFAALSPFNHNIKYMQPFFLYVITGAYMVKRYIVKRLNKKDMMVMLVAFYGALMYYGAFRDIEGPQFQMALQPAVIVLYFFLEKLFLWGIEKRKYVLPFLRKFAVYFLLFSIIAVSIVYPLRRYRKRFFIFKYAKEFFLQHNAKQILFPQERYSPLDIKTARGIIVPNSQKEELEKITNFIISKTRKDEILFTYPDAGVYNFLAERPGLGRFKTSMGSWLSPEWHRELMKELKEKKPPYIINKKKYPQIEPYLKKVKKYRNEMYTYIDENYKFVFEIGDMEVYKSKRL